MMQNTLAQRIFGTPVEWAERVFSGTEKMIQLEHVPEYIVAEALRKMTWAIDQIQQYGPPGSADQYICRYNKFFERMFRKS